MSVYPPLKRRAIGSCPCGTSYADVPAGEGPLYLCDKPCRTGLDIKTASSTHA